jgi:hypothetical protein
VPTPAEEAAAAAAAAEPNPRDEAKSLIKESLKEWFEENAPANKKTNPTSPAWWQTLWGE